MSRSILSRYTLLHPVLSARAHGQDGDTNHATRQVTQVRGRDPAFNQYFTFKLPLRAPMNAESFVRVTVRCVACVC